MLALLIKVPTTERLRKIRSSSADPKYSMDHGPLPHISAGHSIDTSVRYHDLKHHLISSVTHLAININNKKGQLSLTNPRDACATIARFM